MIFTSVSGEEWGEGGRVGGREGGRGGGRGGGGGFVRFHVMDRRQNIPQPTWRALAWMSNICWCL